jgi:hypothetical protein
MPVTFQLTASALLVSLLIGIPLGILSAIRENSKLDHVVRVVSLFSLSMPNFWQATMLILALSLWLHWAPLGYVPLLEDPVTNLKLMFWPSVVLGTSTAAQIMRMTRSSVLDVNPDLDGGRAPGRLPAGRRGDHRGGFYAAGRRAAAAVGHLSARLPAHPEHDPLRSGALSSRQPDR